MGSTSSRPMKRAVSVRVDDYFNQEDTEDATPIVSFDDKDRTLLDDNDQIRLDDFALTPSHDNQNDDDEDDTEEASEREYKWQWRHTVSYWIGIWYTVGGFFFCIATLSDLYRDHLNDVDYYTLVVVTLFLGGLANLLGGYFGFKQVIRESSRRFAPSLKIGCCRFNRSLGFWSSFAFLTANVLTLIPKTFKLIRGKSFDSGTWASFFIDYLLIVIVVTLLAVGGGVQMYLNKCWKWRPYKLGWIISWLNGIAGVLLFISCGIATWWDNGDPDRETFRKWVCAGPVFVGSVLYWIGSVLSLMMWKLRQFGLVNLPFLNKQKRRDYDERKLKKKDQVQYRDILWLILYSIAVAMAFIAISYALQCPKFEDWIKNFSLGVLASTAILSLGSFMHREPKRPPFLYFIWFIRIYMLFYTVNLTIDLWHISGSQCAKYGA